MAEDSAEVVREVTEAVSATDVLVKGNGPAYTQNLSYGNLVAYQQAMQANMLAQQQGMHALTAAIYTKAADMVLNTSPQEGVTDTGIAQILSKVAGNTPPTTP